MTDSSAGRTLTIPTKAEVVEWQQRSGVGPKRSLGQNFVIDPNTIHRIVRTAEVGPGDVVLEVGPGLGSLTAALIEQGAAVVAIEKDAALAERLVGFEAPMLEVVEADVLAVDLAELLARLHPGEAVRLVANLPYNVATKILLGVLESCPAVTGGVVMVQKEVAERLVARPGGRMVGIPSLVADYWASLSMEGLVAPEVFLPRPRVTSALVRFDRRAAPRVRCVDPERMWAFVRQAFGQRRKMIRRSLSHLPEGTFAAAGLSGQERPEQLELEQWAQLADAAVPHG